MTESIAKINGPSTMDDAILERVIAAGDLSKLSAADRVNYYSATCKALGLNPLSQPFQYITLNGKLTLYARKDCTDQLRKLHGVSIQIVSREHINDVYIVTARATTEEGRTDESIGAVSIGSLKGDLLCNAIMKAETKAKRRVTLSVCGLGFLDESEIETIPQTAQAQQIEAAPTGMITTEQKKRLKTLTDGLLEFEIPASDLQKKMAADHKVERSAELTEDQADKLIADLYDWLNSLEEARAANMTQKKEVPF